MMSCIFGGMMLGALIVCIIRGRPELALEAMLQGAADTVELGISLGGAYMLFMGLLAVAREAGALQGLSRLMQPLIRRLIPHAEHARDAIASNMAANILGLGNAATPFGLKAMQLLQKNNPDPGRATHGMCMFLSINASSLQVIPTTVLALRSGAGSIDAAAVVVPTLIASLISTLTAVGLCCLCRRLWP